MSIHKYHNKSLKEREYKAHKKKKYKGMLYKAMDGGRK
ncbi:hypothetical protein LCGC14_0712680 [marine sediment metagenome]|uniref:Uncharacterized protein n=1 Tax=marine sediment metagenome TaxID=412755 RepID=A0A0F9R013_9ZZZZ